MSRRTEIADAAIVTLAREGMRGFTHRAVDRTAGLPEGSTSYYFRTRSALLETTLTRLVDLDEKELAERPDNPDGIVEFWADLLNRWATTGRDRQLARYELLLESTRRPELRPALSRTVAQLQQVVAGSLQGVAGPEALGLVGQMAGPLDGFLLHQVTAGDGHHVAGERIVELIRHLADWSTANRGTGAAP